MSRDHTVSYGAANAVAVALLGALAALLAGVHALVQANPWAPLEALAAVPPVSFAVVTVTSIVAHEVIHGAALAGVAGVPCREIVFGVMWRGLAPYATTRRPLRARAYRWCLALPGLILGAVPLALAPLIDSTILAVYGATMLAAAGGDVAALWAMRRVGADAVVVDDPKRVGARVIVPGRESREGS